MAKKRKDSPKRARGRRRHKRGLDSWKVRVKAAAKLRPFSVTCWSNGHHREYDRALFAAAGRYSDGSGYGGGLRDHYWVTRTENEARAIAAAIANMPGLTRLVVSENMLESLEILAVARRQHLRTHGRRTSRGGKRLRITRGR